MAQTTYSVRIDPSQPLTEMIETGKYDGVNANITQEHFPQPQGEGVKEVNLMLVHLNKRVSTKEVEAEIEKQGLRPGNLAELLAFGAKYPDIQRQFPIAALDFVWVHPDGRRVPSLGGYWRSGERYLLLDSCEDDWRDDWRFLAARA